jgi:hypothetical protein
MAKARIRQIIRQFQENGLKLLLEDPRNAEDLLRLTDSDLVARLDCDRLELVRTTFVQRDYRHVEADLVLRAPLRSRRGRRRQVVWIYILIEHQSEPDELMVLRLLDYVVQIFKHQVRQWRSQYGTRRRVRLQPVVPLVFYTGTQRWESLGQLKDLMEVGELFARVTPHLEPLYLNLGATSAEQLQAQGGAFGRVLRLVQKRGVVAEEFQQLLTEVVGDLESLAAEQRLRWLELLSYLRALVYHERKPAEEARLTEVIERSVQTDEHREEVFHMFRSMADQHKAEGRKEGRQKGRQEGEVHARRQTLLRQLRKRFGDLPAAVMAQVKRTTDLGQLDTWLEQVVVATTLAEVGISAKQ